MLKCGRIPLTNNVVAVVQALLGGNIRARLLRWRGFPDELGGVAELDDVLGCFGLEASGAQRSVLIDERPAGWNYTSAGTGHLCKAWRPTAARYQLTSALKNVIGTGRAGDPGCGGATG